MNETTLFLSQLMGPLFLLMGLSFAFNQDFYVEWFKRFDKSDAFLFLASTLETLGGIAIVLHHNIWGSAPEVIVSLMGWLMIAEGSLILLTTKGYVKMVMSFMPKKMGGLMSFSMVFSVVIGGYLSWVGYFA